jgi:nitrate reductase gamma subunit
MVTFGHFVRTKPLCTLHRKLIFFCCCGAKFHPKKQTWQATNEQTLDSKMMILFSMELAQGLSFLNSCGIKKRKTLW